MPGCCWGWNVSHWGPVIPQAGAWLGMRPFEPEAEAVYHKRRYLFCQAALPVAAAIGITGIFDALQMELERVTLVVILVTITAVVAVHVGLLCAVLFSSDAARSRENAYYVGLIALLQGAIFLGTNPNLFLYPICLIFHVIANVVIFGQVSSVFIFLSILSYIPSLILKSMTDTSRAGSLAVVVAVLLLGLTAVALLIQNYRYTFIFPDPASTGDETKIGKLDRAESKENEADFHHILPHPLDVEDLESLGTSPTERLTRANETEPEKEAVRVISHGSELPFAEHAVVPGAIVSASGDESTEIEETKDRFDTWNERVSLFEDYQRSEETLSSAGLSETTEGTEFSTSSSVNRAVKDFIGSSLRCALNAMEAVQDVRSETYASQPTSVGTRLTGLVVNGCKQPHPNEVIDFQGAWEIVEEDALPDIWLRNIVISGRAYISGDGTDGYLVKRIRDDAILLEGGVLQIQEDGILTRIRKDGRNRHFFRHISVPSQDDVQRFQGYWSDGHRELLIDGIVWKIDRCGGLLKSHNGNLMLSKQTLLLVTTDQLGLLSPSGGQRFFRRKANRQ